MQVLTASPAMIVRQLLIDLGLGVVASWDANGAYDGDPWPVFDANEPDKPDGAITVYDTQGVDFGRSMPEGALVSHFGFQVRVRAATHPAGWAKANAIRNTLAEGVYNEIVHVGSDVYVVQSINRIGQALSLGADVPAGKRRLFTVNATVNVEQDV